MRLVSSVITNHLTIGRIRVQDVFATDLPRICLSQRSDQYRQTADGRKERRVKMQVKYKEGTRVQIILPEEDSTDGKLTAPLRKFDGMVTKVARKVILRKRAVGSSACYGAYYELDGCFSEYGMPYAFLEEWIVKVRKNEHQNVGV